MTDARGGQELQSPCRESWYREKFPKLGSRLFRELKFSTYFPVNWLSWRVELKALEPRDQINADIGRHLRHWGYARTAISVAIG
jgi:hypothetical protein